jgi:hypothetical protein
MSLVLSNTTTRKGIIQLLEDLTSTQSASTTSYPKLSKTRDINNALAKYAQLAISSQGRWQFDDTNHTDYPIISTNLVSGQQDYSFTVDENGNQILDIERVEIYDAAGIAHLLTPMDSHDLMDTAMTEYMKNGGIPVKYDKTANGIFLYPASNYNYTNGLKIYTSRTPSYFIGDDSDDTTKPGIPDVFHEYLAMRPAYYYCLQKGLAIANNYFQELQDMESRIKEYHRDRSKDEQMVMRTVYTSSE